MSFEVTILTFDWPEKLQIELTCPTGKVTFWVKCHDQAIHFPTAIDQCFATTPVFSNDFPGEIELSQLITSELWNRFAQ